jgi:SAM-dependent methyltransferase
MSGLRAWLAEQGARWLLRFQDRHGLAVPAAAAQGRATEPPSQQPLLLHVGCGHATLASLPVNGFRAQAWRELRLDADASVGPDIAGSMTDMAEVDSGFVDAVYSSHGIEHLYWHDVPVALAEFLRVLKDDGFAVITCPDVQAAAALIAQDRMFDIAYESAAGPITPFDILYSYRPYVQQNPQWMSHHCGFTFSTLTQVLRDAGFAAVAGFRRPDAFDLWVLASKSPRSESEMRTLAQAYLIAGA